LAHGKGIATIGKQEPNYRHGSGKKTGRTAGKVSPLRAWLEAGGRKGRHANEKKAGSEPEKQGDLKKSHSVSELT